VALNPGGCLLLDHLVGAQQDRLGDREPERFGGREVDDQLATLTRTMSLYSIRATSLTIDGCRVTSIDTTSLNTSRGK
jgi:hypothetical protein